MVMYTRFELYVIVFAAPSCLVCNAISYTFVSESHYTHFIMFSINLFILLRCIYISFCFAFLPSRSFALTLLFARTTITSIGKRILTFLLYAFETIISHFTKTCINRNSFVHFGSAISPNTCLSSNGMKIFRAIIKLPFTNIF